MNKATLLCSSNMKESDQNEKPVIQSPRVAFVCVAFSSVNILKGIYIIKSPVVIRLLWVEKGQTF